MLFAVMPLAFERLARSYLRRPVVFYTGRQTNKKRETDSLFD